MEHLPPDSAIARAIGSDGSWEHDNSLEMQRALLYAIERAAFYSAKTAGYRPPEPDVYRFPWEEDDDGTIKGDAMGMDEADDWLGWTKEMKDHLNKVVPSSD